MTPWRTAHVVAQYMAHSTSPIHGHSPCRLPLPDRPSAAAHKPSNSKRHLRLRSHSAPCRARLGRLCICCFHSVSASAGGVSRGACKACSVDGEESCLRAVRLCWSDRSGMSVGVRLGFGHEWHSVEAIWIFSGNEGARPYDLAGLRSCARCSFECQVLPSPM